MNRFLRLLLAVLCLLGPWLAAAPAGVMPSGQNSPTEERETSHEEPEEFAFGAAKRSMLQRVRGSARRCASQVAWLDQMVAPSAVALKLAAAPHKPAAKVLLRRRLPTGEDPLS